MNEYTNALTAVIIDGIERGDQSAIAAARLRIKACKASNARKLNAALAKAGAGTPKAAPTRVVKSAGAPKVRASVKGTDGQLRTHTEARKAAWAYRAAQYKAGKAVSYADACAKFGTTPAKAGK